MRAQINSDPSLVFSLGPDHVVALPYSVSNTLVKAGLKNISFVFDKLPGVLDLYRLVIFGSIVKGTKGAASGLLDLDVMVVSDSFYQMAVGQRRNLVLGVVEVNPKIVLDLYCVTVAAYETGKTTLRSEQGLLSGGSIDLEMKQGKWHLVDMRMKLQST